MWTENSWSNYYLNLILFFVTLFSAVVHAWIEACPVESARNLIFRFYNRRGFWPGVCCHGTKQGTSEYERSDEEAHDELCGVENGSKPISEEPGGRDLTLAETTNLYPLLPSLALIILQHSRRRTTAPPTSAHYQANLGTRVSIWNCNTLKNVKKDIQCGLISLQNTNDSLRMRPRSTDKANKHMLQR